MEKEKCSGGNGENGEMIWRIREKEVILHH